MNNRQSIHSRCILLAKKQSLFTIGIPTNRIRNRSREYGPCQNVNLAPLNDFFLSNAYSPNWTESFTIFRHPTWRWRDQLQSVVVGADCINYRRNNVVYPPPSSADWTKIQANACSIDEDCREQDKEGRRPRSVCGVEVVSPRRNFNKEDWKKQKARAKKERTTWQIGGFTPT